MVIGFLRDRQLLEKPCTAVHLDLRQLRIFDGRGEVAFRLGDSRLIGARVNHKQGIAGFHELTVMEVNFRDAARHLRADFGIINRADPTRKFRPGMHDWGVRVRADTVAAGGGAGASCVALAR